MQSDENAASMSVIARFHNAAEAGYFAHELTVGHGIATEIQLDESFDALRGRWDARFELHVPESCAESAAKTLQQMLSPSETTESFDRASDGDGPADASGPSDGAPIDAGVVNWVPIMLTLAAGSAVFFGARQLQERPRVNVPPVPLRGLDDPLWNRLSGPSKSPWSQRLDNGRGMRTFSIDSESGIAIIREDADGDGIFEVESRIRRVRPGNRVAR
jgi:hypothetical protein